MAKVVITIPNGGGGGISIPHNELDGLQGNGPDFFHLDEDEKIAVQNLTQNPIPNAQQVFEQGSQVYLENEFANIELATSLDGTQKTSLGLSQFIGQLRYDSGLNSSSEVRVAAGQTDIILTDDNSNRKSISLSPDEFNGLQVTDQISLKGLVYDSDYTVNQLSDDRAITDVGGIKQLIITETDFSNLLKLTGETLQSVEGDVIFEGNAIGNLTPTQNNHLVRKDYVDGLLTSIVRLAGDWDASGGTFPTTGTGAAGAIRRGDSYITTVAGIIAGQEYGIGDSFYAKVNNPGQTASNWARYEVPAGIGTPTTAGIVKLYTTTGTAIDGTMDQNSINNALAIKANNVDVVHKTGNETITGFKTFLSSTANVSTSYFRNISLGGNGNEAAIVIDSLNNGISSTFSGSNFINLILSGNNSIGFNIDSSGSHVGDYFNLKKNGTTRFKVDSLGNTTANSFVKSGGTSSQFLKADGSVDSNTYATTSVIAQTITNGVTTSAPSQDAVFDALALKANLSGGNNFNGTQLINGDLSVVNDRAIGVGDGLYFFYSSTTQKTMLNRPSDDLNFITFDRISGNVLMGSSTDTGEKLQVTGNASITGQLKIPIASMSTSAIPLGQADTRYLKESNFTADIEPLEVDGVTSIYSFPHGLSATPRVVILTRGEADDFTVFKTTWDATNVIVEFSGAPTAGTINLNWFAVI